MNTLSHTIKKTKPYRWLRHKIKNQIHGSTRTYTLAGKTLVMCSDSAPSLDRIECLQARDYNELIILECFLREATSASCIFDIGANIGIYSLLAAKDSSVEVHAFEPEPLNRKVLTENIAMNHLSNVTIHARALSNQDGSGSLERTGQTSGIGTHHLVRQSGNKTIEVPISRVDTLVKAGTLPAPDLVKLDVEGHEWDVLEGMRDTIAHHPMTVLVERHLDGDPTRPDRSGDESRFKELGFTVVQEIPNPDRPERYYLLKNTENASPRA